MVAPLFYLLTLLIVLSLALADIIRVQDIKSSHLLDLLIRDFTFDTYNIHLRTGKQHPVTLPGNFSGIKVNSVRLRCGSLRRYGAKIDKFNIGIGAIVHPCIERVMVVSQNLGFNWSTLYYSNYDLSGYQFISPILGLLAYNVHKNFSLSKPFEVEIHAPISIDFTNITTTSWVSNVRGTKPLCVSFNGDGDVRFENQTSPYVCVAMRDGHYGLVIESPSPSSSMEMGRKIGGWRVVVWGSIGAAIGGFLIVMLLIAMFVKAKKKLAHEEMERRAYEEEALQVSMAGHVRAPIARGTRRTSPTIVHHHSHIQPPN